MRFTIGGNPDGVGVNYLADPFFPGIARGRGVPAAEVASMAKRLKQMGYAIEFVEEHRRVDGDAFYPLNTEDRELFRKELGI